MHTRIYHYEKHKSNIAILRFPNRVNLVVASLREGRSAVEAGGIRPVGSCTDSQDC